MKPSDIQNLVERRLLAFPEFSGLHVILEREGDIENKVKTSLRTAGNEFRSGIAVVIGTASAGLRQVQAARIVIDPLAVTVTVTEVALYNKPPNGTGRRAGDLAMTAASALIGWTPAGCDRPLAPVPSDSVREASNGKGGAAASFTLATSLELPALRLPGEYGYNAPNIN